jgi:hypothetical protein
VKSVRLSRCARRSDTQSDTPKQFFSNLTFPKPGSCAGAEAGFRLSVEFKSRASISPNGTVPRRHLRFVYVISKNLISSLSVFPYKVKTRLPSSLVFVTIFWVYFVLPSGPTPSPT